MTLTSTKPFPVISSVDPAINIAAMSQDDMVVYLNDRKISDLKIVAGDRAAVFHLREVSHEKQADIIDICTTDAARHIRAFRCAVVEVTDCRFEDGKRGRWQPADREAGLSIDETKLFTMAEILDVGSVAWARSFLGPANVRRYVPPQLLRAHLAALPYQSAEPNAAPPSKSADSKTQESTVHVEASSDVPSGSPTAAPVTADASHQAV